jgi:hypothetical protein
MLDWLMIWEVTHIDRVADLCQRSTGWNMQGYSHLPTWWQYYLMINYLLAQQVDKILPIYLPI